MVSVCSALAGAVLLCVLGALWVLLRRRRKLEEQAKVARVGAWHTLRAQRGHRRDASGSGRSSLSMVQSRKVEVPETTQMLISTVWCSAVLRRVLGACVLQSRRPTPGRTLFVDATL